MAKYHYKHYINRAFWNSLFAVLSALVLVLILLYGWAGLQAVLKQIGVTDNPSSSNEVTENRLEALEELRGQDDVPLEEKYRILEALRPAAEGTVTEEESLPAVNQSQP